MAVAVTNTPETTPKRPAGNRLAQSSLFGVAYILASLVVLGRALPWFWATSVAPAFGSATFISYAVLAVVLLGLAAGAVILGRRLLGADAPHGTRAGIAVGLAGLFVIAVLTQLVGFGLEGGLGLGRSLGLFLTALVGAGLLAYGVSAYFKPGFNSFLVRLEDQGWFSAGTYKRGQGQRVRRATLLGLLAVVGAGIYVMDQHRTLAGVADWGLRLPYLYEAHLTGVENVTRQTDVIQAVTQATGLAAEAAGEAVRNNLPLTVQEWLTAEQAAAVKDQFAQSGGTVTPANQLLVLLPHVRFTLPLLLTALALWGAYRVVNFPVFADFLIATEAELNKVSWASRKKLFQDTVVVLTTVLLMTIFLFIVDVAWYWVLSSDWVGILKTNPAGSAPTAERRDW